MQCTLIPTVKNYEGADVPSTLFKQLSDFFTDRQLLLYEYYFTKTSEFKAWDPITNWDTDEVAVFYSDRKPYYLNHAGEKKFVFEEDRGATILGSEDLITPFKKHQVIDNDRYVQNIDANELQKRLDYFNDIYRKLYHLKNDLFFIEPVVNDKRKLRVDQEGLDTINHGRIRNQRNNTLDLNGRLLLENELVFDENTRFTADYNTSVKNFIKYKKKLLNNLQQRLDKIRTLTNQNKNNVVARDYLLKQKHDVTSTIETMESDIKELETLVQDNAPIAEFNVIREFGQHLVDRMKMLYRSTDVSDLTEANSLADFFYKIGTLDKNNPIFTDVEASVVMQQGSEDREMLQQWSAEAQHVKSHLQSRYKKLFKDQLNSLPQLRAFYKRVLSDEDIDIIINAPMKDTHPFDAYFMDAASGVFSTNGIIPQVMEIELNNASSRGRNIVSVYEQRMGKVLDLVRKALEKRGFKVGKEVSYEPFLQEFNGQKTGAIIHRYSPTWDISRDDALTMLIQQRGKADEKIKNGDKTGYSDKRKANEEYRLWYKNNTHVVDFMRLDAVVKHIQAHPLLSTMEFYETKSRMLTAESLGISKRHYNEIVNDQIRKLDDYANNYKAYREQLLGVKKELSEEDIEKLDYWVRENGPGYGYRSHIQKSLFNNEEFVAPSTDGNGRLVFNNFEFNILVPKKENGYWDERFNMFDDDNADQAEVDALYEMREIAEEMIDFIGATVGVDKLVVTDDKSIYEILFANDEASLFARLSDAWQVFIEKLRELFLVDEGAIVSNMDTDINNKELPEVNSFLIKKNLGKIHTQFLFEARKFKSITGYKNDKITRYTRIPLKNLNSTAQEYLKEHLGYSIPVNKDGTVSIGKYLHIYAANEIIKQSSFNLPKTLRTYIETAAEYNARQEVKPIIDVMLDYYKNIKKVKTNNIGEEIRDNDGNLIVDKSEDRDFAIKQITDWYRRAVLLNFEEKQNTRVSSKSFYSLRDKKLMNEIAELQGMDEDEKNELIDVIKNNGKKLYLSQGVLSILKAVRFKGLAFNINSQTTNFAEGQFANEMMIAQTGIISYDNWYKATDIMWKYIGSGVTHYLESEDVKKTKLLMEKFNVFMDVRNEFQKSLEKTSKRSFEIMKPYGLMNKVEFANQSPLMIGTLMEEKIYGKNEHGERIESSVWDALDSEGKLKEEFRSEENIANWEDQNGDYYNTWSSKINRLIINTHGDYSKVNGMMIKSNLGGKAFMMFKTWMPRWFFVRFATEQDDLQLGIEKFKGRYRSHTAQSAMMHGGILGLWMFGLPGIVFGSAIGYGLGAINRVKHSQNGVPLGDNPFNVTDLLHEQGLHLQALAKRMVGMPVNRILNKNIINIDSTELYKSHGFNEVDARNLQANLNEIVFLIGITVLSLMAKGLFWDDDDEEDSKRRIIHNLLINRLNALGNQAAMFADLDAMRDSVTNVGILTLAFDTIKLADDVRRYVQQDDILQTGPYRGQSRLMRDMTKAFTPTALHKFGFESQMRRQLSSQPWDQQYWSEERKEKALMRSEKAKDDYEEQQEEEENDE